jgi:IS5 family transposase
MRQFAGVQLSQSIPDERVNAHLVARGLMMRQGTMVDATIINAPSSTKNKDGGRAPQMHQTKKGNPWFFGLKAHIGVDRDSGLVHTVVTTAANVADVTQAAALLHGEESQVFADAWRASANNWPTRRSSGKSPHGAAS